MSLELKMNSRIWNIFGYAKTRKGSQSTSICAKSRLRTLYQAISNGGPMEIIIGLLTRGLSYFSRHDEIDAMQRRVLGSRRLSWMLPLLLGSRLIAWMIRSRVEIFLGEQDLCLCCGLYGRRGAVDRLKVLTSLTYRYCSMAYGSARILLWLGKGRLFRWPGNQSGYGVAATWIGYDGSQHGWRG